jgi:leucyl-tRNA synthetase
MILVRDLEKRSDTPKDAVRDLVRLLAPFAPQLAEHLWEVLGGTGSVHQASWPAYDAMLLAEETATVTVQVDGKRRGDITLAKDASEEEAIAAARMIAAVAAALGGAEPARAVYVPGRIVDLVARKDG